MRLETLKILLHLELSLVVYCRLRVFRKQYFLRLLVLDQVDYWLQILIGLRLGAMILSLHVRLILIVLVLVPRVNCKLGISMCRRL